MKFFDEEVFSGQAAADINFEKMVKSFMANQSRNEGFANSLASTAKVAVLETSLVAPEASSITPGEALAAAEADNAGALVPEPQESQIAVEAGFSISDNQWEYLAWNPDVAQAHTSSREAEAAILQGFCSEVAVPVTEHVILYDSDGLEALCSRQGGRCCNGGRYRPGNCPTLAYRLAYIELSCHVLAQELEVKQHKLYNRKFE